ncbi:MAG: amidohydrolase family protein [Pseudomonadota bacterium]
MSTPMNGRSNTPAQFGRIFPPDAEWLCKQLEEPILEPELPIIDTHHHLWDRPNYRYLLDELLADTGTGHKVIATVFAECNSMYRNTGPIEMRPVGQTQFVAGMAAMSESGSFGPIRVAAGIVGYADLGLGDRVTPVLEAHIVAGGGRFRGVRYSTNWDASDVIGNGHGVSRPAMLRDPVVRAGIKRLIQLDLSLDAWVFHPQLSDVVELASAFPDLNTILGHVGGPLGYGPYAGKRDEVFSSWKASMTELARYPNISVKLGGMMMRLASFNYLAVDRPPSSTELAAHWRPYVETCIDLFGADRCMFESNFPVEKMGASYATLWNAFKRITAGASAAEKHQLYSGTARRVYRLAEA